MLALGVMIPVLPKLIIEFEGGNVAAAAGAAGLFGFSWATMQFVFSPLLGAISDRRGRRPVIPLVAIWGLSTPAFQALTSRRVEATEQGRLQGALASMSGITGMAGPLLFTQIFAFGISSRSVHAPGAPFWTSSLLLGASLLVALFVAHDAPKVTG